MLFDSNMPEWHTLLGEKMEHDVWYNVVKKAEYEHPLRNLYWKTAEEAALLIKKHRQEFGLGKSQANRYISAILNAGIKAEKIKEAFLASKKN